MRATTLIRTSAVATIVALLVSAGSALGDRDGKGGGGGGDDRGGGDRSGGSARSSSGGGSNRSSSARSFSGGSDRSSSVRSSDGNRGVRSSDAIRSSDGNRSVRSSDGNRSSIPQTFRRSDSDDRSSRSIDTGRSTQGSSQFRSGSSDAPQYEARRPTNDNVKDFLGLRGSDSNRRDGDRDRNVNLGDRDRNIGDRDRDRNNDRWSKTWFGNKGDGRDDRDWSGHWKDSDRFNVADRIRRDWDGRRDNDRIFHGDWWHDRHRGDHWGFWGDLAFRHNRPWYWWSWATGPRLASWIVFGWPTPYYWDYGPGEYIYCDNGGIYVNGRWYEPAPVYYEQTVRLVEEAPDLTAESAARLDWMPLGVFAATPDGVADPMVVLQLAVTKDGVIGGTAFDQKSGAAYNVQGLVDKRTQRAVWSYRDDRDKRMMMETGIYNLTQSEATGMVHYSPTDMRVVELVRLQEPNSGDSGSSGSSTTSATLPPPPTAR